MKFIKRLFCKHKFEEIENDYCMLGWYKCINCGKLKYDDSNLVCTFTTSKRKYKNIFLNDIYEYVYLEKNEKSAMNNTLVLLNDYKKQISIKELIILILKKFK